MEKGLVIAAAKPKQDAIMHIPNPVMVS
jgi:hypothetical protein